MMRGADNPTTMMLGKPGGACRIAAITPINKAIELNNIFFLVIIHIVYIINNNKN